jgi:hypothetical protein
MHLLHSRQKLLTVSLTARLELMVQMSVCVKTADICKSTIIPAVTDAVPYVRLFPKKNGWITVVKMYWMHLIFMLYLLFPMN